MKTHSELLQYYLDTVNDSQQNRDLSELDRDYYDNKQWTDDEVKQLEKRKQPVVTFNRIKPKIDSLIGLEIRSRVDVKAYPRTPGSDTEASAITDALRYVSDNSDFDQTKSHAAYNLFVEGTCAAIIEVEKTAKGFEIVPRHIPWDRLFFDMHGARKDGQDCKYMGQAIWLDIDDAKAMFPDIDGDILTVGTADGAISDTYDDRPRNAMFDAGRNRTRIIEMFYNDAGQWYHAIFNSLGFMVEPRLSPYLDECNEPCNPIEIQHAFMTRNNRPYGFVRNLISPQDEINKRRSKSLHLLSVNQVIAEEGAVKDVNAAKRALADPSGWLIKNPGKGLEVNTGTELAMGQFQLLAEAKNEIDQIGANSAVTGKEDKAMSGRALEVRQYAGTTEVMPVMDSLRSFEIRCYRQMYYRIKQFWSDQKWIRVTDDEQNVKFVGLNQPITFREMFDQRGTPYDALDPRNEEIAYMQNKVSEIDVDIILDVAPDQITLQGEQFEMLTNMYAANPDAIPFEMVIEASNIRNKDRILERFNTDTPEAQAAAEQQMMMQQRANQLQEAKVMAEISSKEAKAAKDMSDAQAQGIENAAMQQGLIPIN